MRPFTSAMRVPRRLASWIRFGQSSVSTSSSSEGFTTSSARLTECGKSKGAKNRPSSPRTLFFATSLPVSVVVERKTRWPGNRSRSAGTSGRAASTSPTETAWIQIERSPSRFR